MELELRIKKNRPERVVLTIGVDFRYQNLHYMHPNIHGFSCEPLKKYHPGWDGTFWAES